MAREPVQENIDGVKYTFGRHMPKNSLKLFNRIMKIIAPTIAAGVGETSFSDAIDKNFDISGAINILCSRMDEPEVEAIFDIILGEILHNGGGDKKGLGNCRDNYDAVFLETGIAHVYKVILAGLEVEYQNFFGKGVDLGAMWNKAKDLIPANSQ